MKRLSIYILLILGVVIFVAPSYSRADFYKYVDENGKLHITNNPKDAKYLWYMKENSAAKHEQAKGSAISAASPTLYDDIITRAALRNGVDPALVKAVIKAESDFDSSAVSKAGARGLMQLMPETAMLLGVKDVHDPEENVEAGTKHLKRLMSRFGWNLRLAVAAYNAGETAVMKYGAVPPYKETQGYVTKVLRYHRLFKSMARY